MSHKFNGGRGADICDGCFVMLTSAGTILKPHLALDTNSGPLHYCGGPCMLRHATEERGMHKARVILLAQEAERLAILGRLARFMDRDVAFASPIIGEVERHLVSKWCGPEPATYAERYPLTRTS